MLKARTLYICVAYQLWILFDEHSLAYQKQEARRIGYHSRRDQTSFNTVQESFWCVKSV
jgi:hypothetical protein